VRAATLFRRAAERELARQARQAGPAAIDLAKVCHPKQARLVRAIASGANRNIDALCGRQSGKSHGGSMASLLVVKDRPRVNWLYVTSTYATCEKMAFNPAKFHNTDLSLGFTPLSGREMQMRHPNGSTVYFLGADHENTIVRLRGTPNLAGCIIDEAGIYDPENLKLMIETVRPGLRPLAGKMVVMGTPSRAGKQGTWYDITENDSYDHHRFDYRDNDRVPSFADVERLIDEELTAMGLTRDSAYFKREYLALFEVDLAEKVYQITNDNLIDEIPTDLQTYTSAGDIGVSANDALVSIGWRPGDNNLYVADQEEAAGQDSIACADMVNAHNTKRHPLTIAMDPGGLGQKTIKTVQRLYPSVPITEAHKPPIGLQVRAVNQLAQGGRLKLKRGSKLALELSRPTWVDGIVGGEIDEHGKHSDLVPSLRYCCIAGAPYFPFLIRELTPAEKELEKRRAQVARAERNRILNEHRAQEYDAMEFRDSLTDDIDQ
jgi:hypothetical protein